MYEEKFSYLIIFIYAVPPGKPEIETSEALKEGDHIICRSNGGRPSPQLEILQDGEVVPSDMLPMNGSYYVIRSSPVNRTWNGKHVACRYSNEFFNNKTTKFLNVKCKLVHHLFVYVILHFKF